MQKNNNAARKATDLYCFLVISIYISVFFDYYTLWFISSDLFFESAKIFINF